MTQRTLTLTATNAAGSVSASVAVTVANAPPGTAPEIVSMPVNMAEFTAIQVQFYSSRYERDKRPLLLTATPISERFSITNLANGGGRDVGFRYPRYGWLVDGVERASYTRIQTQHVTSAAAAVGAKTILLAVGTLVAGDVVRFANHTDEYEIRAGAVAPAPITISNVQEKGLSVAVPAGTAMTSTQRLGSLVGALGDEADGLHKFDVVGYDAAGAATWLSTYCGHIDREGKARDDPNVVFQNNTHDWAYAHNGNGVYQYAIVPKAMAFTTRAKPRPARIPVLFTHEAPKKESLVLVNYAFQDGAHIPMTPYVTSRGITGAGNLQPYFFNDMTGKHPPVQPQNDGVFGIATLSMVCDLKVTHAVDPATGKLAFMKIIAATPFADCVIGFDGTKRTLTGLRHTVPPLWSEAVAAGYTAPNIEIVGNWDSSIPRAECFPSESWASFTDPRTTPLDPNAPPIGGQQPHLGLGPEVYRPDAHGYILKQKWDGKNRDTPAVITRWKPASDPWGMDGYNNILYVCERTADRISMHDLDTGAYLGDFVSGPHDLGELDSRRVWIGESVTETRKHDCVGPEGFRIAVVNGVPYAYWGSRAQRDVRRAKIGVDGFRAGPVEVVAHPEMDNNSFYLYLAVNSDTRHFGPPGAVFITSWSVVNNGRPQAFVPSPGVSYIDKVTPVLNSRWWGKTPQSNGTYQDYGTKIACGTGGYYDSLSYATACDVGPGILVMASAQNGLDVMMLADPAIDGPPLTLAQRQQLARGGDYYDRHFAVLHGSFCVGPNYPLPWGANPDCDAFMLHHHGSP